MRRRAVGSRRSKNQNSCFGWLCGAVTLEPLSFDPLYYPFRASWMCYNWWKHSFFISEDTFFGPSQDGIYDPKMRPLVRFNSKIVLTRLLQVQFSKPLHRRCSPSKVIGTAKFTLLGMLVSKVFNPTQLECTNIMT